MSLFDLSLLQNDRHEPRKLRGSPRYFVNRLGKEPQPDTRPKAPADDEEGFVTPGKLGKDHAEKKTNQPPKTAQTNNSNDLKKTHGAQNRPIDVRQLPTGGEKIHTTPQSQSGGVQDHKQDGFKSSQPNLIAKKEPQNSLNTQNEITRPTNQNPIQETPRPPAGMLPEVPNSHHAQSNLPTQVAAHPSESSPTLPKPSTPSSQQPQASTQNSRTDKAAAQIPQSNSAQSHAVAPEKPFQHLEPRVLGGLTPEKISQKIQEQVANHLPDKPLEKENAVLHGHLIIASSKEHNQERAERRRIFAVLRDREGHTLHEPRQRGERHGGRGGEHSRLTREERRQIAQLLRERRGHEARLKGERGSLDGQKFLRTPSEKIASYQRSLSQGDWKSLLSLLKQDPSIFAQKLAKVLMEGENVERLLPEGMTPEQLAKESPELFAQLQKAGNEEKIAKMPWDEVVGLKFGGLLKEGEEDKILAKLVADLMFEVGDKERTEKLVRIAIDDPKLLELLKELKPGEKIPEEIMQRLKVKEALEFTKMAHVREQPTNIASEVLKNVVFDPKAATNPYDQAKLEHQIFSQSRKRDPAAMLPDLPLGGQSSHEAPVFANVYDLVQKERKQHLGNAKLYTALMYFGAVVALTLILYYLFV